MHTTASDGTDTPEEIIKKVRAAGIELFSVTDHDTVAGTGVVKKMLSGGDLSFVTGIEFSCKDEAGEYHILGYNFNPDNPEILRITKLGHSYRIKKATERLAFLDKKYGFTFPQPDIEALLAENNPGKPHIARLMIKYSYAKTMSQAIRNYLDKISFKSYFIRPEEAISAIISAGGIPVLAHPSFGSGKQFITGEDMEARLKKLMAFDLKGLEAFYSGFDKPLIDENLGLAKKYNLFVTAGSDYHGKNKTVPLGKNHLSELSQPPEEFLSFLKEISGKTEH